MATLSARSLTQALSQARNIGLVEEPFVVGDTSIVVRNLRPDQYDSIFKECQGLSDVEYLNAWQMGHICRSICELNGIDLREVQYIEDEEPDPKKPGQIRTIKLEAHSWLRKNIISTWSRETLYICYRKVSDVVETAEKKAQEGVSFRIADEGAEDKVRRLLGELKEMEDSVPERLFETILKDNGFVRIMAQEDIQSVDAKLAQVTPTPVASQPESPETPVAPVAPEAPVSAVPVAEVPARKEAGPPTPERMAQLLRNRVPMNQQPQVLPQEPQIQPPATIATPQAKPPVNATPQASLSGRTVELAALESDLGGSPQGLGETPATAFNPQQQATIPEVRAGSVPKVDTQAAQAILDQPPVGGINPRFRPPTR